MAVKQKKRITLADVSEKTGVSVNTVAKVLSGKSKECRISDKTANRVKKAANQIGYVPNIMARMLRSDHTKTVAVFISDITDATYAGLSHLILEQLSSQGYYPFLSVAESGLEHCRREWIQHGSEGLILCGSTKEMTKDFFRDIQQSGIAIVFAGCAYHEPGKVVMSRMGISSVSIDNYKAINLAVTHLQNRGREKIAFIGGPSWHLDAYERLEAYEKAVTSTQDPIIIKSPAHAKVTWWNGYRCIASMGVPGEDYDAIIAYDDMLALGAAKRLLEYKISIPETVSIVGIDNSPEAEFFHPSLTSVTQPLSIISCEAMNLLDRALRGSPVERKKIAPKLIVRKSTINNKR